MNGAANLFSHNKKIAWDMSIQGEGVKNLNNYATVLKAG
jgi:hypothetical protein